MPAGALRRILSVFTIASLVLGLAITGAVAETTGGQKICTTGTPRGAAAALFGRGAEFVGVQRFAGVKTALVLEPRIYPGTRRRMVAGGGQWCEATSGFNTAWRLAGRSVGDGLAMAKAYASVAAAPYFDGVSVTNTEGTQAGTWVLKTHARTNGVEARWVISTDARGIRSAAWTATAFAQKPFEASWEGLTALPGLTETYTRIAGGVLDDARGLPTAQSAAAAANNASDEDDPGLLQHTFQDGYTIVTSMGDAHVAPNLGTDTGVWQVDVLRATMRAARENYEEFLSWGLSKGWRSLTGLNDDVGYVYVNDALSLACLACVFISDHFQIHIFSEVQEALAALGYDGYQGEREQSYSLIIGHEMFHNFQNRYDKPGHFNQAGRQVTFAYLEGTARFQETLHTYAETTFAENTLVTANDANGCNGFDTGGSMDAGMAQGPFSSSKTYSTCFLWGPWYVTNRQDGFLDLVREGVPAHAAERDAFLEVARGMEQATGKPVALQLAEFAGSSITGRGRAWSTWFGTTVFDWGSLWERWTPKPLEDGKVTRTLGPGGMMANELTRAAKATVSGSEAARLYILRDIGGQLTISSAKNGKSTSVGSPRVGERIYAFVVRPAAGSEPVTLNVAAKGKLPPAVPAQAPISGTVTTLAPGVGARVSGVTSQFIRFDVPTGVDNASAEFVATYPLPADIDLFIQRQNAAGTWTAVEKEGGETGSTSGETMTTGRLEAGAYRIEIHNWAGPAGNQVTVKGTFFNSVGEAGV